MGCYVPAKLESARKKEKKKCREWFARGAVFLLVLKAKQTREIIICSGKWNNINIVLI